MYYKLCLNNIRFLLQLQMTRRCCKPFPRGTLLVLLMSDLLYIVYWFMISTVEHASAQPGHLYLPTASLVYIYHACYILLSVTGWIGESWLGRYRAILFGLLLSAVTFLIILFSYLGLKTNWIPMPVLVLTVVAIAVFGILGFGSLYTIMLPFSLDQMIGASAEQLSAAVQWYCWGVPHTVGRPI